MSTEIAAASVENAIERLFRHMVTLNASDLYLTADSPPVYRVDGVGMPGKHAATGSDVDKLANELAYSSLNSRSSHATSGSIHACVPSHISRPCSASRSSRGATRRR